MKRILRFYLNTEEKLHEKCVMFAKLQGVSIGDVVNNALVEYFDHFDDLLASDMRESRFTRERFIFLLCSHFQLDVTEIVKKTRLRNYTDARRMLFSYLYGVENMTLREIQMYFKHMGGWDIDHATIIHAKKTHLELVKNDYAYGSIYKKILAELAEKD
jgi:chromosomal replication initiation ATPase DnaA